MPRIVLWRKNRFVKKPSPLKNAVLADDSMDVDTHSLPVQLNRGGKQEGYGTSSSDPISTNGGHGQVLAPVLEKENKSNDTPKLRPEQCYSVSFSEQFTPTRKRKLENDSSSSIDNNSTSPSSAPRPSTHPIEYYGGLPVVSYTVSSLHSGPIPYPSRGHPRAQASRSIRPGPQLPLPSNRTPAPSPNLIPTPQHPKPSLIVKLKVPTWFKAQNPEPIYQTTISQVFQPPKESRTPASRATKCPTCGGIHTSTCLSNMDRLDEIDVHLSFLGTLTQAATMIAAEVREHFEPASHSIPASSASSTSPLLTANDNNAAKDEGKTALKKGLERLLSEGQTWLVKARPLMLEAAMREGNLEEGEKLREEIKRDGGVVKAGEAERYFLEARERILGGMRDGMACGEGV